MRIDYSYITEQIPSFPPKKHPMICPECQKLFDPADRATAITNAGAEAQIVYCSVACKRRAGNRRDYERHKRQRIDAVLRRRHKKPTA